MNEAVKQVTNGHGPEDSGMAKKIPAPSQLLAVAGRDGHQAAKLLMALQLTMQIQMFRTRRVEIWPVKNLEETTIGKMLAHKWLARGCQMLRQLTQVIFSRQERYCHLFQFGYRQ